MVIISKDLHSEVFKSRNKVHVLGVEPLEEPSFDQNLIVSGLGSVGPQTLIGCT